MRVLVVEDYEELAEAVAGGLRREGIAVDVAFDGTSALERTAVIDYDVVVLDRDLPDVHGDEVCRTLVAARRSVPRTPPTLEYSDLTLDPARRLAVRCGRRLDLTAKEFGVLEYLLAAEGRIVSAEELLERVWDENADPFTTAVKNVIKRLRTKLGEPPLIHTVREGGYRI